MIDRPNNQGTDRPGHREVSLSIKGACFIIISISEMVSDLVLGICTNYIHRKCIFSYEPPCPSVGQSSVGWSVGLSVCG